MPDMNENAETQQEYFGNVKLETDYKDLSMRLYKRIADLEKENAELKEENNRLTDTVVDLKCKVSEANSNAVIWTEELVAENKYLTKQIEKMKHCENCGKKLNCRIYANIDSTICDDWEIKEND